LAVNRSNFEHARDNLSISLPSLSAREQLVPNLHRVLFRQAGDRAYRAIDFSVSRAFRLRQSRELKLEMISSGEEISSLISILRSKLNVKTNVDA
jgi:hypothetical protein